MMNVIALMGRLVANPELRKTPNGVSTCTFSIACDHNFVASGSERQTDFFDIVTWRQTAEFACKYFRKGQLIGVNGSLQTRFYLDKSNKKHKVIEILADNLHFADSKRESDNNFTKQESENEPEDVQTGNPNDATLYDDITDVSDLPDLPF